MSELDTLQQDDPNAQLPEGARNRLRELEKEVKRMKDIEADNTRYKQKDQLRDSGVNLTDKQLKALNAAHEGESNPDEWRKTAEELGFVQPEVKTEQTPPADQQAHQQLQAASSGAVIPGELSSEDAYAQANSPADVLRIARERGTLVADDMQ
jgi:uncharacterized protein YpuA (DUF1002 family)